VLREDVDVGVGARERRRGVARMGLVYRRRARAGTSRAMAEEMRELRLVGIVALGGGSADRGSCPRSAEEEHLARPGLDEARTSSMISRGAVTLGAARVRDDAEGAALVAAFMVVTKATTGRAPAPGSP